MVDERYLEVRRRSFLFGGESLELDGRTYYFKHNYENPDEARDFAERIVRKSRRTIDKGLKTIVRSR